MTVDWTPETITVHATRGPCVAEVVARSGRFVVIEHTVESGKYGVVHADIGYSLIGSAAVTMRQALGITRALHAEFPDLFAGEKPTSAQEGAALVAALPADKLARIATCIGAAAVGTVEP